MCVKVSESIFSAAMEYEKDVYKYLLQVERQCKNRKISITDNMRLVCD